MPHFSLLTLPRSVGRWSFLTSYQLHQLLWRGFPKLKRGEQEQRFLYRHDENDLNHTVLVQSVTLPNWSFLDNETEGTTAQVQPFDIGGIRDGDRLRFFIRANPTVLRKYSDGSSRHIAVGSDRRNMAERRGIPLESIPSREAMMIDWLQRKGSAGGFVIEQDELERALCIVAPNRDLIVRKASGADPITLTLVDFRGILRVEDVEKFRGSIIGGIGRGKAFGCGLLSVARLRE